MIAITCSRCGGNGWTVSLHKKKGAKNQLHLQCNRKSCSNNLIRFEVGQV